MAFNFGTPAGSSTPSFSFGGASTPAFGAAPTPGLAKTASTPLFGTPPPAAGSSPSLFGASSAPAFNFSTPSQPGQPTSLFGAAASAPAPATTPAFSFPSSFGGAPAGQQQQQQQLGTLGFQTAGTQGAAASAPDDSALKELQSIKDSYIPSPGNHRHRFQYLFLNVVENPAARVKPAEVDELQWREALRRAGGPDNPDHLWPVQAQGFKGLLARKAAQDEAIKEHSERLQALQQGVASLAARHEAILKTQFEATKKKTCCFVSATAPRPPIRGCSGSTLEALSKHLASLESTIAPGSTGGLQGKVDALLAAARQRAGAGVGRGIGELEAAVDPASLQSAFAILSEYSEALSKMQAVLRRNQREVAVLDNLVHGVDAMN
ncbi:hypothetical protein KSW81_007011 [Nannochloris sp. 'desiccata']|nr:hypothetical protein KSW81_007011 [Chlorella desiccata (nom. nud.)]